LFYTDENELHGYWDTVLVSQIAGPNYMHLAKFLSVVAGKIHPPGNRKATTGSGRRSGRRKPPKRPNHVYDTESSSTVTYEDKKLKSIRIELPGTTRLRNWNASRLNWQRPHFTW
jgi:hypothetical protein